MRYMHFFERFANQNRSIKFAKELRPRLEDAITLLHETKGYNLVDVKFLPEACLTVIKARSVLKWSYPFAYYMEKLFTPQIKNMWELWQKDLERHTERLTSLVEQDMNKFLDPD